MDNVTSVLFVEILFFLVGLLFFIIEFKTLKDVIKNKQTLSMLGILISINLMVLCRVIGIYTQNLIVRTLGASLFALMSCICIMYWSTLNMQLPVQDGQAKTIGVIIGISLIIIGRNFTSIFVISIGIIVMSIIISIVFIQMSRYVLNNTPYIRARYRTFLFSVSFIFLAITEGIGVILMDVNNHQASISFLIGIIFRFGILLSILLPQKVTSILSHFIK